MLKATGARTVLLQFNADEWNKLSASDRIAQCLHMTNEIKTLARQSRSSEAKLAYTELAESWLLLSFEMKKSANPS